MHFILFQVIEFFSTAVTLIPAFLLFGCCSRNISHALWCYVLALYWGTVYVLTGLPTINFVTFDPNLYLIPFAGFINDLGNSILNILLFVPMGFFLPLLCEKCRNIQTMLKIGLFCSLSIELSQLFTYRVTDINDLITNTAGTALGYFLFTRIPLTVKTRLSPKELLITAAVSLPVMFFLQQALASYLFRLAF